jgi:hypothetical protein
MKSVGCHELRPIYEGQWYIADFLFEISIKFLRPTPQTPTIVAAAMPSPQQAAVP